MEKAFLALEDGTVFEGRSCGISGEASGEVVFQTDVVGYQEVLTTPSCRGQIVALTIASFVFQSLANRKSLFIWIPFGFELF